MPLNPRDLPIFFWSVVLPAIQGYNLSATFSGSIRYYVVVKYIRGPNPTKHDFPDFTHICKIFLQIAMCKFSYKFMKWEILLIFASIFDPILQVFLKNGLK
jgi:hypothetical protein